MDPEEHVLIIGAGTFGLSTALELLRGGHKNVTLLDAYPVPSPLAAGNDVNKIFQSVVRSQFYSDLSKESLRKWRDDPVYQPAYHETGIIYGASMEESYAEIYKQYEMLQEDKNDDSVLLETPADFLRLVGQSGVESLSLDNTQPRFDKWKGYYQKKNCGWTYASLALERASMECIRLGAKMVTDSAQELLFDKKTQACLGVRTYSGLEILAAKTVICAGANSVKLLDFHRQLLAKCWTVGHIRLTDAEIGQLKGSPVVLNIDKGFVFEPDAFGDLKFCNEFPGYINMETIKGAEGEVSVPVYKDAIPKEAETQMRDFLREVLPRLSDREFNVAKICWCTDTPDRHFLIDEHPQHTGLILGTGDSGQGFKYMPIVGEYIASLTLHGRDSLPEDKKDAWRWRPETAVHRDNGALQNRYGGSNAVLDLKDVAEWSRAVLPAL